jgi:hypothetical protein
LAASLAQIIPISSAGRAEKITFSPPFERRLINCGGESYWLKLLVPRPAEDRSVVPPMSRTLPDIVAAQKPLWRTLPW